MSESLRSQVAIAKSAQALDSSCSPGPLSQQGASVTLDTLPRCGVASGLSRQLASGSILATRAESQRVDAVDTSGILVGLAATEASVLALTFSLGLFVLQRAADAGSRRLLHRFLAQNSVRRDYIGLAAFSVLDFCMACLPLRRGVAAACLSLGIGMLVLTWVVVWRSYRLTQRYSDPSQYIQELEEQGYAAIGRAILFGEKRERS